MEILYSVVRGPLALIAFTVFILGILFQVSRFYLLSRKVRKTRFSPGRGNQTYYTVDRPEPTREQRMALLGVSVLGAHPLMTLVTSLFHICLLAAPLLALGHTRLIYESWGLWLPALPERWVDIMAWTVVAGGGFFLLRRLLVRHVRAITGTVDFLLLLLTVAPFVTGILAFHQVTDYDGVIVCHMLAGEVLLVLIPFTRLMHMIFFFINRLVLNHQGALISGSRTWHFNTPGFSLRRWYLGRDRFEMDKW